MIGTFPTRQYPKIEMQQFLHESADLPSFFSIRGRYFVATNRKSSHNHMLSFFFVFAALTNNNSEVALEKHDLCFC